MRYLKTLVYSTLLFTIPTLTASSVPEIPKIIEFKNSEQSTDLTQTLFSYDDVLRLLEKIENFEMDEHCNLEEMDKINQFLVLLAKRGALHENPFQDLALNLEAEHLLSSKNNPYSFCDFFQDGYSLTPCIFYGNTDAILCKSWFKKQWDHTRAFAKHHKKEIIIGAVIFVSVVVVVGIVAAVSTAGAVATGTALSTSDNKETIPSIPNSSIDNPSLPSDLEEHISSFKENVAHEQFFEKSPYEGLSIEENGRILGSAFAYDTLNHFGQQLYTAPNSIFGNQNIPHSNVNQAFATNPACFSSDTNCNTGCMSLAFQMRGEQSLNLGCYKEATYDFGKAIELDPTRALPYLQRGIAHFELGNYDRSLEDYHQFTVQVASSPKTYPMSVSEFSFGFAKGLPKGIYDSSEGTFLFLSDLIRHPIHTGSQMWEALTLLSSLAKSEQWSALSEVLVPEVHQLVTNWDTIPSEKRGELAGYAFGKYGSDVIIPGVLAKAVSKGLKGAQEINAIYKGLQTTEQVLVLESAAGIEGGVNIGEIIQTSRKTINLGEELGFSATDMGQLKQAGKLEDVIVKTSGYIFEDPAMQESFNVTKRAETLLEPHIKKFMSEERARELIHQTGIQTFPRPKGIPENYIVMISDKGAGMKYVHPKDTGTYVRIMPGKPHSPFPYQQKPYANQRVHGKSVDKHGNIVLNDSSEAHIPIEEFIYKDIK